MTSDIPDRGSILHRVLFVQTVCFVTAFYAVLIAYVVKILLTRRDHTQIFTGELL